MLGKNSGLTPKILPLLPIAKTPAKVIENRGKNAVELTVFESARGGDRLGIDWLNQFDLVKSPENRGSVTQTGDEPQQAWDFVRRIYQKIPTLARDAREASNDICRVSDLSKDPQKYSTEVIEFRKLSVTTLIFVNNVT